MESYDDVGYTIEERDTALEFDEEYLLQMYTNMITNYTVFKSLLESDPRKMSELAEKKYEPVRPKFVREIKEEIVEDRNIPDVEIRQVFVEEVTQAQLEAEEKLKQETERCQELERQNGDLEWEKETNFPAAGILRRRRGYRQSINQMCCRRSSMRCSPSWRMKRVRRRRWRRWKNRITSSQILRLRRKYSRSSRVCSTENYGA